MIDLHLHLDGSLPPELFFKLAAMEGVGLPAGDVDGLLPYLTAPRDCKSLNEFLEKFALPVSCLQSEETLFEAARGLAKELGREGLVYAEVRFAPQLHRQKGLTQRQAIQAVIRGLEKGREGTSLKTGLILCCMRGRDNRGENLETVAQAAAFSGSGVCGLDLAGAEALYPTRDFEEIFGRAREENIPFTIHAGEADGPESIRAALSFGARRIGHGVRVTEDKALLEEVIEKQITLEMCITSNLQTKAVREGREHPALWLLRQGAAVTVNTDDMTVCGTTVSEELKLLRSMGMTREEERKLWENAVKGAFLPEEEKEALGREVRLRL